MNQRKVEIEMQRKKARKKNKLTEWERISETGRANLGTQAEEKNNNRKQKTREVRVNT